MLTGKTVLLTAEVLECPDGDYVLVRVAGASGPSGGVLPVRRDNLRPLGERGQCSCGRALSPGLCRVCDNDD